MEVAHEDEAHRSDTRDAITRSPIIDERDGKRDDTNVQSFRNSQNRLAKDGQTAATGDGHVSSSTIHNSNRALLKGPTDILNPDPFAVEHLSLDGIANLDALDPRCLSDTDIGAAKFA